MYEKNHEIKNILSRNDWGDHQGCFIACDNGTVLDTQKQIA